MTDPVMSDFLVPPTRRQLLTMIGKVGGASALYQAMTVFGHAAESQFTGPPKLSGAKPGASVLVLGSAMGKARRAGSVAVGQVSACPRHAVPPGRGKPDSPARQNDMAPCSPRCGPGGCVWAGCG